MHLALGYSFSFFGSWEVNLYIGISSRKSWDVLERTQRDPSYDRWTAWRQEDLNLPTFVKIGEPTDEDSTVAS